MRPVKRPSIPPPKSSLRCSQLWFRPDLKRTDIGRVLALSYDAVTTRLLDFAIARHGPAPRAWAWLALGSVARRELTLASDQDNALAYADPADSEVDAYFERLAQDVNAGLVRAGFGADTSGVLASNTLWRMSESLWVQDLSGLS